METEIEIEKPAEKTTEDVPNQTTDPFKPPVPSPEAYPPAKA